jgi:hypothetical protein
MTGFHDKRGILRRPERATRRAERSECDAGHLIDAALFAVVEAVEIRFGKTQRSGKQHRRERFAHGEVIMAVERDNLFGSGGLNDRQDRALVEKTAKQFAALADLALAINQNERGRVLAQPPRSSAAG